MGIEIERKFLLDGSAWRAGAVSSQAMRQGYLGGSRCSMRVRVAGDSAWLNLKSLALGPLRSEYEFEIPLNEAEAILEEFCETVLEKMRYLVPYDGHEFEVDEFHGANAGLIVAELELSAVDAPFPRPTWLGAEVTGDPRYYNLNLVQNPFRDWPEQARSLDASLRC